jgi:hypothetical protein
LIFFKIPGSAFAVSTWRPCESTRQAGIPGEAS